MEERNGLSFLLVIRSLLTTGMSLRGLRNGDVVRAALWSTSNLECIRGPSIY